MKKLLFILLILPAYASAAIIDHGTYFQDTDTGLYWLKLTETRGIGYDELNTQFTVGQPFEGWRFAKLEELEDFIEAYGIPKHNNCTYGNYCKGVWKAEKLEQLIRLFGDTHDAWLDETNAQNDTASTGAGAAFGHLGEPGDVPGTLNYQKVYTATLEDREEVDRITQLPVYDGADRIVIRTTHLPGAPSFLVRNTDPTIPQDGPNDPNNLQLTVFDNLVPEDFGFSSSCSIDPYNPYGAGPCNYDANSWSSGAVVDYAGILHWSDFALYATSSFDAEARPWVRITGHDYTANPCDSGDTDLGNNWCRKDTSSAAFQLLPGSISGSYLDYGDSFSIDNLELEFIHSNIQIDYDPWNSANTVRPKDAYFVTVGVKTLSVSDGDPIDFDATQIDPATVMLGPDRAPNNAIPLLQDIDGDGDLDRVFGFRVEDTGISCLDTSVTLVAKTLSGEPLADQDVILPIKCEEIIDIDFDPFNTSNTIRPNDDYNVTVALLGMQVANGDPVDVTPGTGGADDIDPASLNFGPAGSSNTGTPVITDIDGDTHDDMLITFNAFDSGIACGDETLEVTGEKLSGIPIEASDTIVTEDCDTGGCHP
jgi:hypothetical protein